MNHHTIIMNGTTHPKRVLYAMLLMGIAIFLTSNNIVYAQGPKSPEAASFEPVDATDIVNLLTGDMTYTLPLLNIPSPSGGYPIALSYHAGIAVGQEASWVGLGWNINPGAINRNVSGIPDDWKEVKKYNTIYNKGGVSTSYSVGVSVGWENVISNGIYATYSENKAFGGENTYRFDVGVSAFVGISDKFGIGASLGTNGIGINAGYAPSGFNNRGAVLGFSASKSFINSSTSIGMSVSGNYGIDDTTIPSGSLGISFNSKGGQFLTSSFGSHSLGGVNLSNRLNFNNTSYRITIPFVAFNISFGYNRSRYWLYDNDYTIFNGALYAGDVDDVLNTNLFDHKVAFDSYQAVFSPKIANQLTNTNYSYIGYDNYSVSGQGIGGTIQPNIFEEGILYHKREVLAIRSNGSLKGRPRSLAIPLYTNDSNNGIFTKSITNDNFHFYFNNEGTSYLEVISDSWNVPQLGTSYNDVFSFDTSGQNVQSTITINGTMHDGYNPANERLRTGSFIETFINSDIITELQGNNNIQFIEAKGITRNTANFPSNAIGGYRITTTDGKTYHYSLPVYQREFLSRSISIDKNESNEFYEESQFEPYATHWLLTAITGPDYVDINSNNILEEEDFGYWVEFEYGKWSDGFSWRTPVSGYEENRFTKQYSWGVKDLYYLDRIKTRTHTALFIKEVRDDLKSSTLDISNGNNPAVYKDTHIKSYVLGNDNNYYLNGVYDDVRIPYPPTNYFVQSEHEIYLKTYSQRSLKLSKIVLLKNNDPNANISKSNVNQHPSILAGEVDIDQNFELYNILGQLISSPSSGIHQRQWNGEFFENVLDITDIDINAPGIEANALKVIDFNTGYNLVPNSPNSSGVSGGKLTLNSVRFRGKKGVALIPPYRFEYQSHNTTYDNDNKDEWGYNASNITAWNMNKIITPLGGEIAIEYEGDKFHEEAAITNFVFGKSFEMKFEGTSSGSKWVKFRNLEDNEPYQDINFLDYFQVGNSSRINVNYYFDGFDDGDRVADVDQICTVTAVSPNEVTFTLPINNIQNEKRNGGDCNSDNWVYYNMYSDSENNDDVVYRTANWVGEKDADDCNELGHGTWRAKIEVYSNKTITDKFGGGIRVKEVIVSDESNNTYKTLYSYDIPDTTTSSGITSFEPSKNPKEVKFITELPGPTVMYEYVTVTNVNKNESPYSSNVYHFNVLKPMTLNGVGFDMNGLLSLSVSQDDTYQNVTIDNENTELKLTKFHLENNLSALGHLISKKSYNQQGHLLSKTANIYKNNLEIDQGVIRETFKTYKKVVDISSDDKYFLSSSSKIIYPNILKATTTTAGGYSNTVNFDVFDFITGDVLETSYEDSQEHFFKTELIPAYSIDEYSGNQDLDNNGERDGYGMGSKVDAETNKNMLTQAAMTKTSVEVGTEWEETGVGITTWNNDWNYTDHTGMITQEIDPDKKIWRKHKSYVWDGDINPDGTYSGFTGDDDSFDWTVGQNVVQSNTKWKNTSTTTQYNHYSMPLEVKDINDNYTSTKMCDDNSKILTVSNAGYNEMYYSGAEYIAKDSSGNDTAYFDGQVKSAGRNTSKAHTGTHSVSINSGASGFEVKLISGQHRPGMYKVSVWIEKTNHTNARIHINGVSKEFNEEDIVAGDWVLKTHYETLSLGEEIVYITSANNTIYADDFKLHPVASSMTSYVYNEWDELWCIIGANGLASKFEYDEAGRLIKTYTEVIDDGTLVGGFKQISENDYHYNNQ